ncbi:diphthine--ammonia ligase [Candidatus Pacearchaeota archaeon]|nr:diphthine--ammonia ligase [Candidatus Pacearchaeota archaeon]
MKVGVLFSGGKDSCYASFLAKKAGYDICCLISIVSENPDSFMFHTPSITCVEKQAEAMDIPLVLVKTIGKREEELYDLEKAIKLAIKKYKIKGIVTGAVESVYQSSRIQKICNKLGIECFNPLWQKNQEQLIKELIKNRFDIVITGVFAYPFDVSWILRKIDKNFINEIGKLNEQYKIAVAGEGGEFESLVLNCPLFKRKLKVVGFKISGSGNAFRSEVRLK